MGSIWDRRSRRDCATGVGMLPTQMMITENKTTVIERMRIVPMTSETPDVSSRRMTFMSWPPGGLRENSLAPEPTIYKVFVVVTTTTMYDSHLWRDSEAASPPKWPVLRF